MPQGCSSARHPFLFRVITLLYDQSGLHSTRMLHEVHALPSANCHCLHISQRIIVLGWPPRLPVSIRSQLPPRRPR